MTDLQILLVEDDAAHARLIIERVREAPGVRIVEICETLGEAVELLKQRTIGAFDAVLLDLGLPDSDGIDSVRGVHAAAPRLPIVVLSGHGEVSVAIEAMRHGAQDYIVKGSADALQLARVLRLACERKRMQDTEQMLIGVVSHDLRGPLQTIVLGCELMMKDGIDSRHVLTIRRAALRSTALVNDLLDATRARLAGVLPVELNDIDLAAIVGQVIEDTRMLYPSRAIESDLPPHAQVQADAQRMIQLAQNLIVNAVQHSPAASPVRVSLRRDSELLELRVHNDGTPIPEHLKAHIFEPLERAPGSRVGGVGLGLYIASEIARAHGGAIDVDSQLASGTTFTVRLPTSRTPSV